MSKAPIGVFDSGIGGLAVLSGLRELLPHEQLLYLSDTRHVPYGPKGEEFIRHRCFAIMDFLLEQGAKAVVVACNTATAAAINALRERYSVPLIGVEPAVKPAAQLSQRGVVGVLATSGTIASDKFFRLQDRFLAQVQIVTRACPGLVELIEADSFNQAAVEQALREFTAPMVARQADVVVLGCTHYSLIRELIQQVLGPGMRIVDAGLAVARETRRRLEQEDLLAAPGQVGDVRFFTSGDLAHQQMLLARYWGGAPVVEALPEVHRSSA